MNSTANDSLLSANICCLKARVYSPLYLFFKLLNSTYLRLLIGPGVLLNILCLLVLSRPRLSSKSTTIVFLRFLALFDILAISMKYIRAETNYQSITNGNESRLLITPVCNALYVLMNTGISVAMWTIALMSLDKAVAVSVPLKSSIWVTHRRAVYICCCTIVILLLANLSFIKLSKIKISQDDRKYCGLTEELFIIDFVTASILPMSLITITNVVIAVVLHQNSRTSLVARVSEDSPKRVSEAQVPTSRISVPLFRFRGSATSSNAAMDVAQAAKRRMNAQVTRMLLAVTLSLIICNIPNTLFFISMKIKDTRQILAGRQCADIPDRDIQLYKFSFYLGIIQDILSDLPHIFNFFLYCLAGKKFRAIFLDNVQHFLRQTGLLKGKEEPFQHGKHPAKSDLPDGNLLRSKSERLPSSGRSPKQRRSVEVLLNGKKTKSVLSGQNKNLSAFRDSDFKIDTARPRSITALS